MEPNELERLLTEAKFVHLIDDELSAYRDDMFEDITLTRAAAHLKLCLICERRLTVFREEKEALAQPAVATADVALVRQLLQRMPSPYATPQRVPANSSLWERLREFFAPFAYGLALQEEFFTPRQPLDVESADGRFGLFLVEEPNGDVTVRTDSSEMQLAGTALRFFASEWQRVVRFEKVADDRVGAEVIISRAEREALSDGTILRAEPVPENGGGFRH
jgi:hypothetical protein